MGMFEEEMEQVKSIKHMKLNEAAEYIWEYFKVPIFLFLLLVLFVVLIFQTVFGKKKETVFSALFINVPSSEETKDTFSKGFISYAGIDEKESECFFDMDVSWNGNQANGALDMSQVAGLQKLMVTIAAGECDLVVCDRMTMDYLARGSAAQDMEKIIGKETLAGYEGKIFYVDKQKVAAYEKAKESGNSSEVDAADQEVWVSKDPSDMKEPVAVGLDIKESYLAMTGFYEWDGESIVCFPSTLKHKEMAGRFLEYCYTFK